MISKIIRFVKTNYLLLIILLVAAFFRFYHLRWDSGFPSNPDEGNIVLAASRIKFFSDLNPKFFVYGGLPIYLISAISQLVGTAANLYRIHLISRILSALASVGGVFFIYFVARKLFGKYAAILASVFATFSPGLIQYAHFGVSESIIIFSLLGVLYSSLRFYEKQSNKNALLVGFFLGAGIASKFQSLSFILIPLTSLFFVFQKKPKKFPLAKFLTLMLVPTLLVFLVFNPFIFIDRSLFLKEFVYEASVAQGTQVVHYTLQFIGVNPFMFNIKNIFWLTGPIAIFGFLFLAWLAASKMKKDTRLIIFIMFPLLYFFYINTWQAKFIRYMLPVVPFLLIAAAGLLLELRQRNKIIGNVFLSLALITTIFYGLAFFNLYRSPMTTFTASEWIFKNVPADSKILTEALDLKLPLSIPGKSAQVFQVFELPMYQKDTPDKIKLLTSNLANADYLIFSSSRFWKNIPKDLQDYPASTKFYEAIFDGSLGYRKVAEFNKYPNLLGIDITDDSSEETFKVFDHPQVLIFRNEKRISLKDISNVLLSGSK